MNNSNETSDKARDVTKEFRKKGSFKKQMTLFTRTISLNKNRKFLKLFCGEQIRTVFSGIRNLSNKNAKLFQGTPSIIGTVNLLKTMTIKKIYFCESSAINV